MLNKKRSRIKGSARIDLVLGDEFGDERTHASCFKIYNLQLLCLKNVNWKVKVLIFIKMVSDINHIELNRVYIMHEGQKCKNNI